MIQTLTLAAVVATAAVVGAWNVSAATVTSANDYPSTLQTSQAANHRVLFTTPAGVSEGSTITLAFAASFDTSTITEDDIDVADDGVDLTTASSCGSAQASVAIASDVVTITICAGGGGAIAATSAVAVEIGTNATSSGTGSNQITNPSSTGNYYVSIAGTFGDSGSIILPIGGDDSISVTATVPSNGGELGGGGGGAPADTTAPTISDIVVSAVSTSSATVSWTTSEAATRLLDYGLTTSFELGTVTGTGYYTSHSVTLSGLSEGTTYYFRIRAADSSGNTATSSTQMFTTTDETDPIISDIEVVDITTTSARVTWTTNESADSTVSYGLTTSYSETEIDSSLVTSHSVLLTDLAPGTTYHFQVLSTDASSNQAFSDDETFTTDSDDPPANVSNLSIAVGDEELTLSWTNPSDDDLAGILVLQCLGGYPTGPTDTSCTSVSTAMVTSLLLLGLTNDTTYYYGVFAYDDAGQFASGALVSGTPRASDIELPPPTDSCGDGICAESETSESCPIDCTTEPPEPAVFCGDGICSETETSDSCPADCSTTTTPECGDTICSADESSLTCPGDCGEPEWFSPFGAGEDELSNVDLIYQVADESITLQTTSSGVVEVLPTSTLRVAIPSSEVSDDVSVIYLTIGSDSYLMRLDDALALYVSDLTTPDVLTLFEVSVLVTYEDSFSESISSYLRVVTPGYVYQAVDGEEVAVSTASVTLFGLLENEFTVWDGSPYSQFNPTSVASDGFFAWYVPNGTHKVSASASGFESASSETLTTTNNIVNPRILLVAIQEEVVETPVEEEPTLKETEEAPASLAETFIEALPVEWVQQVLGSIRNFPGIEEAAEILALALAIIAGASIVILAIAFDLLPFLQYLFTAPILFFWRRRRKGYGVVYNAIAKTPIDLAVVRLFKIEDEASDARGRLVKSRVTDKGGRYFFLVQPGKYRLMVTKSGFQFPSEYLKGEKIDGSYLDVYHGEVVEVTADNAVIIVNIPLDPSQAAAYHEPSSIRRRKVLRGVQQGMAVVGVLAAITFALLRPTIFSVGMVVVQIVVYLLVRRLVRPYKPTNWGIVYDQETGRPLSRVVARIFEPKYDKVLETQVTDSRGHYAFMLGSNTYYATFEKQGFKQKEIGPIDYSGAQEPKEFSQAVPLEPEDLNVDAYQS